MWLKASASTAHLLAVGAEVVDARRRSPASTRAATAAIRRSGRETLLPIR